MGLYKVQDNGKAPSGLKAGDEVVTGGGTYRITGVNADGSYQSQLSNRNQTTYSYQGAYDTRESPLTQQGVSGHTRQRLQGLEGGYTPSGSVQRAQEYLNGVIGSRPGAYESKWDPELTRLYEQITNRKPFEYDLNADMLYQQYKDQYQRLGRTAMQDTMGQAASLTGGYGSTYSEQVGQQAYNAYLQSLNDLVPQLYESAYSKYRDEGNDLYNRYGLLQSREQADYNRYRDAVSDYYSDLSDARSEYDAAYSRDYTDYANQLSYWQQKAAEENDLYLQQQAAAAKSAAGGGGSGISESSSSTEINGRGDYNGNVSMARDQYDGVQRTISTLLGRGDYDRAYDVAIGARGQMSQQQWADVARRIYEVSGIKIDDSVKYKKWRKA